ncbi:MAG TPA: phasin family protein, partial [Geminicoccaceae bacterium]|nr:phasin family protein [Geminicoccaceae bacterium]
HVMTRAAREVHVAADKPRKPNLFDPEALVEAQRRNFDALTNAGQILADGMRTYAERQVTMVQEAMGHLWGELQASASKPSRAAATTPAEQMERMRAAFAKVVAQVQELGNLLLKVQSEAVAVLNECAAKNLEALGGKAPELAGLQRKAKDAFETASRQTSAAIDEMKRRMATLEEETRKAAPSRPTARAAEATAPSAAAAAGQPAARRAPAAAATPGKPPRARRATKATAKPKNPKS